MSRTTLLGLLVAWLLLQAQVHYGERLRDWESRGIGYPLDTGLDIGLAVVGVTAAVATLALVTPSVSVREIAVQARRWLQGPAEETDRVAELMGVNAESIDRTSAGGLYVPGLPQSHLIGAGPELSERLVMTIVTDPPPVDAQRPYYWRAITYDQYTGNGWASSETAAVTYDAGQALGRPPPASHQVVEQRVRFEGAPDGLLYRTGALLSAGRRYQAEWRVPPPPSSSPAGDLFAATINGRIYEATSWFPIPGDEELKSAGDLYPDWVRDRFLSLPDTLPSRVLTLTRELVASVDTPYEQAKAIENYLRTFTYTLDLPAPPSDHDVVDHFLFELKRGYCDYYATAFVVMARAAGLPARLVVGYASGTYDSQRGQIVITEAEAHSWAEVYFTDWGWIEFEPTGGRPPLDERTVVLADPLPGLRRLWAPGVTSVARWWWLIPVLSLLAGLLWFVWRNGRVKRLSPVETSALLYARLWAAGRRLGAALEPSHTPYEALGLITERLGEIGRRSRWGRLLAPAILHSDWLIDLYVRVAFGAYRPDHTAQAEAQRVWQQLRLRLWLVSLWRWLPTRAGRRGAA